MNFKMDKTTIKILKMMNRSKMIKSGLMKDR